MFNFNYVHFNTLSETLDYIRSHEDFCPIAGGTDVIIQYRAGKQKAADAVDVLLPELTGITETDAEFIIGSSTTLTDFSDFFSGLPQPGHMLHLAAESVGSCQTRNLGTVGGNICTGNASSDMATAFLAANADVITVSASGERRFPIDQFFIKNRVVNLNKDELLKAIVVPKNTAPRTGALFTKVGKRRGHVIATFNIAAAISRDENGIITDAKLAAGTLAPKPIRLYESEKLLTGRKGEGEELKKAIDEVISTALTEIHPRDSKRGSKEYRAAASMAVLSDMITASCGQEE